MVAFLWLSVGTPASAFDLPEGNVYVDETSIDDWLDAGVIRYDEWEQLREWASNFVIGRLTPAEEELLPVETPVPLPSPPIFVESVAWNNTEPRVDLVRGLFRADVPKRVHAHQQWTETLGDGRAASAHGFIEYAPSLSTLVGFANVSGSESWTWDNELGEARRDDPSRITTGFFAYRLRGESSPRGLRFLVGDYGVGYGNGLVINTARRRYPSGYVPIATPTQRERGITAEYRTARVTAMTFVSRNAVSARLSPGLSGLDTTATIANVIERRSAGFHAETRIRHIPDSSEHDIGFTIAAHDDRNRVGVPLDDVNERARVAVGLNGEGYHNRFRWRSEVAYSGGVGGWLDITRRFAQSTASVTLYALETAYANQLSNRTGDRRGVDARVVLSPSTPWTVGGRFASERRLSTHVTSQQGRVWCSAPILRRIRGNVAFSWRNSDVLRSRNASRADIGFHAPVGGLAFRARLTERWNPRRNEWTGQIAASSWRGGYFAFGGRVDRSPRYGTDPREIHGIVAGTYGRSVRVRVVIARRWSETGTRPENSVRVTFDGSWSEATP
jgi:hypothetical protein